MLSLPVTLGRIVKVYPHKVDNLAPSHKLWESADYGQNYANIHLNVEFRDADSVNV